MDCQPEARRVALCARPIELTEHEFKWLKRRLPVEVAAQCERFNVWTTGEALEVLLDSFGDSHPYERARRAEIEAALNQPPWATTWPEWQAAFDRVQARLVYDPPDSPEVQNWAAGLLEGEWAEEDAG
jgi:hypothetical protein